MVTEYDANLGKKTTFGIGGLCDEFFIPESVEELIGVYNRHLDAPLLAAGSNVVISDKHRFSCVISLLSFNDKIVNLGSGVYYVGASVRNQKLIREINQDGYGGIEDLISVPGTIGGAIYMNAGTGIEQSRFISQHVVEVEYYNGKNIVKISGENCGFSYRHSRFQDEVGIIIGATLKFAQQSLETSEKKIDERMERVRRLQDHSGRTCGTLFKTRNHIVMKVLKAISFGYKDGIHFSKKTSNWLVNSGRGNYDQFCKCVDFVKKIHGFLKLKYALEVEVWD